MPELAVPVLPIEDLDIAKRFYVDQLGFTLAWEYRDESGRQGMLGVQRGGMKITLDCPMSGHGRNACVSLEVESADRDYEEWKGKEVAMTRPPHDEEWGARTFGVADPFGNTIFVMGPLSTTPRGGDAASPRAGDRPNRAGGGVDPPDA